MTAQVDAMLFDLDTQAAAETEGLGAAIGASPWVAVLLLVGNGLLAPIAEERVWRGIVQTELVDTWGVAPGIAVTAVLFALKHVVVDGSVARLTTLLALGLVFGLVRHRWGTASSTVTHVATNTIASASIIAVSLYGPV
ncbi:CPBP family intramembrane glutamic endopeptidase [Halorarum halophilum]|uniref:CPBP family intramembrane glutamic endopeptidase n=1 Tax=Halorarum halophilum TaxID=2743090 RepID=UPI001C4EFCBA|nr:CPBP family intramembrane glutamic endopeptidase [Halobaculum halophilum]